MQRLYFSKFEAADFTLYFQLVSNEKVMAQIKKQCYIWTKKIALLFI